eukprot:753910-Hanusia_phi.AAC.2
MPWVDHTAAGAALVVVVVAISLLGMQQRNPQQQNSWENQDDIIQSLLEYTRSDLRAVLPRNDCVNETEWKKKCAHNFHADNAMDSETEDDEG